MLQGVLARYYCMRFGSYVNMNKVRYGKACCIFLIVRDPLPHERWRLDTSDVEWCCRWWLQPFAPTRAGLKCWKYRMLLSKSMAGTQLHVLPSGRDDDDGGDHDAGR